MVASIAIASIYAIILYAILPIVTNYSVYPPWKRLVQSFKYVLISALMSYLFGKYAYIFISGFFLIELSIHIHYCKYNDMDSRTIDTDKRDRTENYDRFSKKKIIIGIHGMSNKPPKKVLQKWWRSAILEGLNNSDRSKKNIKYKMVYWAKHNNSMPLDPKEKDPKSDSHVKCPYPQREATDLKPIYSTSKRVLLYKIGEKLSRNKIIRVIIKILHPSLLSVIEIWLRDKAGDVVRYWNDEAYNRRVRNELAITLKKYERRSIMIIAHSFGSVIAYESLTKDVPEIMVDTFVTLGSPLHQPDIINKIRAQSPDITEDNGLQIPHGVRRKWYNFSDPNDPVSSNYKLHRYYKTNECSVKLSDQIILNDYCHPEEGIITHCVYGYLRAREVSEVINEFLIQDASGGRKRIRQIGNQIKKGMRERIEVVRRRFNNS